MASIRINTTSDTDRRRGPTWLQGLATATVVSVFVLVIIGGVVRVTGSGLGCPDWPLCYGKVLPPLEYTAIIEYTHRFVASVIVGPLILVTAGIALARYRSDRWVWVPAAISVPLLIVQGLLGGVTVLTHLPGGIVALHLATAEALLATCVFIMVASYRTPILRHATQSSSDSYHRWAIVGALSVYAVIVSGALVTAMGATGACVTWPLCQGQAFPMNHLTAVHMFHRYVVLVLGALLLYAAWRCWNGPTQRGTTLRWLSIVTVATFVVQIVVGAATIWLDFQAHWRALHLTAATAVWTAAAGMAIVAYLDVRTTRGATGTPQRAVQDGQ
ncbi:MAG: COX15/CtaA family protein [Chloroflexi bacterium]|nr:COX15/CtaA family protein [Chloroflexota bacterium]